MTSVSGDVRHPNSSPMLCPACQKAFKEPRLLPCHHSVCFDCLDDQEARCPVCNATIPPSPEIPVDALYTYLLSNQHNIEGLLCANCEISYTYDQLLYCNTCSEPLCRECRELTHSAKMFSRHEIVEMMTQRINKSRQCDIHNEPFIMYNEEDKALVCISCFRDISLSKRTHCTDIESAYSAVLNALTKSVEYTTNTQTSLNMTMQSLEKMIKDVQSTGDKRLDEIEGTFSTIIKAVKHCNEKLVEQSKTATALSVNALYKRREQLGLLQPTLHNTLTAAQTFSNISDRFDLVEYGAYVIERLQGLTSKASQLQPVTVTATDAVDARKEFAECLGLILAPPDRKPTGGPLHDSIRAELIAYHRGISRSSSPGYSKQLEQKSVHIDELQKLLNTYKNQVQELHRDITIRRCSAGATTTVQLTDNCTGLQITIAEETSELKQIQPLLENSWKETLNGVVKEQERYKDRMSVLERMKNETHYLITLVKQLAPFIHNYKAVSAKIHPKLSDSSGGLNNMTQIIQTINEMTPDSEQRIAAIEQAGVARKKENSKGQNTLEYDLKKQKGKLRSVMSSTEDISQL